MTVLAFECQTLLWGGERERERLIFYGQNAGVEEKKGWGCWLEEAERDAEAGTVTTGSSTRSERPRHTLVGCVSV